MKLTVAVTRVVHQTLNVEVEVPDEELEGMSPRVAEETFMNRAEGVAGDHDFSSMEKDAEYEAEPPQLPMNINWVKRPGTDIMVIGSFTPEGTLGTVEV